MDTEEYMWCCICGSNKPIKTEEIEKHMKEVHKYKFKFDKLLKFGNIMKYDTQWWNN